MNIAILGTGIVGRTLGQKLHSLGHKVVIGTRNVSDTMEREEPDAYGNPPFNEWHENHIEIRLETYKDASSIADVVFNCTFGQASLAALEAAGEDYLKGKLLIDVANPLDFSQGMPPFLKPVNTDSLGEQIQRTFPEARVVKTLNTMNAEIMVNPTAIDGDHNVFMSGNDEQAKAEAKNILKAFGWSEKQIIDLGDITTARGTEMLLPIWLRLWNALGTHAFNFHIQVT